MAGGRPLPPLTPCLAAPAASPAPAPPPHPSATTPAGIRAAANPGRACDRVRCLLPSRLGRGDNDRRFLIRLASSVASAQRAKARISRPIRRRSRLSGHLSIGRVRTPSHKAQRRGAAAIVAVAARRRAGSSPHAGDRSSRPATPVGRPIGADVGRRAPQLGRDVGDANRDVARIRGRALSRDATRWRLRWRRDRVAAGAMLAVGLRPDRPCSTTSSSGSPSGRGRRQPTRSGRTRTGRSRPVTPRRAWPSLPCCSSSPGSQGGRGCGCGDRRRGCGARGRHLAHLLWRALVHGRAGRLRAGRGMGLAADRGRPEEHPSGTATGPIGSVHAGDREAGEAGQGERRRRWPA